MMSAADDEADFLGRLMTVDPAMALRAAKLEAWNARRLDPSTRDNYDHILIHVRMGELWLGIARLSADLVKER